MKIIKRDGSIVDYNPEKIRKSPPIARRTNACQLLARKASEKRKPHR